MASNLDTPRQTGCYVFVMVLPILGWCDLVLKATARIEAKLKKMDSSIEDKLAATQVTVETMHTRRSQRPYQM